MSKQSRINSIVKYAVKALPKKKAKQLSIFIRDYYRGVPGYEIEARKTRTLAQIALGHFELALAWTGGHRKIRIYNPDLARDGWELKYTVIQIVTTNSPFLVDTVMMELNRHGYTINLTVHPLLNLQRDSSGKFTNIDPSNRDTDASHLESFLYIEVDKETDPLKLDQLTTALDRVLEDTRLAVADWEPITSNLVKIIEDLETSPCPVKASEVKQAISFFRWLLDNNFIFLGYRDYDLTINRDEESLRIVPGSGRGILSKRDARHTSHAFDILPENIKRKAQSRKLLTITKSNSRSTVHRPVHLDYIGILRYNMRGNVIGEHRILGLYSSAAYMNNPESIPLLKDKIDQVMQQSGLVSQSHDRKALLNILHTYPRDELFQTDTEQLYETAMGILHLQERQQVRLFVRRDLFDRFFACIIFIPKERYHSGVREKIQLILKDAFNGTSVDFSAAISDSVYAQLYLIIHTQPGTVPDPDLQLIESKVTVATRSWTDNLKKAFLEKHERVQALALFDRYKTAFPAAYMEDHDAEEAVIDCRFISRACERNRLALNLYHRLESNNNHFMMKLFNPGSAIPLSTVLPILENMGLFVDSERPYEIHAQDTDVVWVHDFDMQYDSRDISELIKIRDIFREAFKQIWYGKLENDGLNQLVLCAGLEAREIMLIRAYSKYIRQMGTSFSEQYIQDTLINNSQITKLLVGLFFARFSPELTREKQSRRRQGQLYRKIESSLDAVSSLDEDRILRRFFDLIQATLRTNYFQLDEQGLNKEYLSLKVSSAMVPDLPYPCPKYEIFVYSSRVEGIHLRGGKVARGGLRWSDRREDFRTEVLGLMKAQMVKNAVIVPVGAKGGFYVKQPPVNDRQALLKEGIECYRTFIRGLLDITDNRVSDSIVTPENVVCYDDDDPYLVVAADKGTATFSDIANKLAAEYGFWLGDAFASGGSDGYDHKKMGITARGAWESVKHNFQSLGIDIQNTAFTVVGIGDMAGDVFGNGMLLSPCIKLVAAFNHMHIFIDPNPDPASSITERRRLFELPGSSWADYDEQLISVGGGIFSRSAKSIQLSGEIKKLLHVDVDQASPDELVRMLLMAPVDLLWNGGIGTYVKADDELNIDVGDKANDNLRINSSQLGCRVIGEGGNLGFTQRARISFADNQGRINADWIDNSGGVDCSDREVNIKILLNKLIVEKKLSLSQRNRLLKKMTNNVAELVLQDNYRQVRAISVMEIESVNRPGWYALLIDALEKTENFARSKEHIPDQATIDKRRVLQMGFSRPETAVLLAHTKTAVYNAIIESRLPDDAYLTAMLIRYFPTQLHKKYADAIEKHRLRREIIATVLTNSMVNRAGITFAHRLADETGASVATVGKAFLVARDVFDVHGLWQEIDKLDHIIPVSSQAELVFETQHLLRHATRWFVRHEEHLDNIEDSVRRFSSGIRPLKLLLRKVLGRDDRRAINERIRHYRNDGIPARTASRFSSLRTDIFTLELSQLALQQSIDIEPVIELFFAIGSKLNIHTIRYNADILKTENVWQDRARVDFIQDLNRLQSTLTARALAYYKSDDEMDTVTELWLKNNKTTFDQYLDVYDKMKFTETNELSMLSVVLSKLRKFT